MRRRGLAHRRARAGRRLAQRRPGVAEAEAAADKEAEDTSITDHSQGGGVRIRRGREGGGRVRRGQEGVRRVRRGRGGRGRVCRGREGVRRVCRGQGGGRRVGRERGGGGHVRAPRANMRRTRVLQTHTRLRLPTELQPPPARLGSPRRTTHEGADLDEAPPDKAAQRETETTEVGGEDETSRPRI